MKKHVRLVMAGWSAIPCRPPDTNIWGQAYEGLQDAASAFLSYNIAYRRDSLDAQTVARIAGIFNNNQQFKDAVDVTEVYRLSDTTNIDVNRQNAKAYCMLKEYGTAVKRYESLKELGDRSFLTLYYLGVSHYGDNWFLWCIR